MVVLSLPVLLNVNKMKIGELGEALVARWLELHEARILKQNWRCRWGEIDLIVQESKTKAIAFVEVKTRSQNSWDEAGLLAVDPHKQQKIVQTASLFLAQNPQLAELPCRFDVALVRYGLLPESKSKDDRQIQQITRLSLRQDIIFQQYRLRIENYLLSAFDLS